MVDVVIEPTARRADGAAVDFRVLIICTGNHCRSPLIEFLLRRKVVESGLPWSIGSAGVRAGGEAAPHPQVIKVLDNAGIDATDWRSRRLTRAMIEEADLVLTATDDHRSAVLRLLPTAVNRTFTLLQFVHLVRAGTADSSTPVADGPGLVAAAIRGRGLVQPLPMSARSLPDPMGRGAADFRACARVIDDALESILAPMAPAVSAGSAVSRRRPIGRPRRRVRRNRDG